jgi:cellulose synthase/poly-beta-1,6-N-acetylglucosamine synthase-like glycosyltransferase
MLDLLIHLLASGLMVLTLPGSLELALLTAGALLPKRRENFAAPSSSESLRLAVIIPAYNEELSIARTINSLLACTHPLSAEDIVVMACNTTDRTVAIAESLGCTTIERHDPTRPGKGYGLDYAFRSLDQAGYDAYVIVDADSLVSSNFIDAFRRTFAGGAKAAQCVLGTANASANARTSLMHIALLAFTFLRPLAQSRLGLSVGIFGNGFGIRSDTVIAVPYTCFSITEDLEYRTRLIRSGVDIAFVEDASVFCEVCTDGKQARTQRERWEGGRLRIMLEDAPGMAREIVAQGRVKLIEPLLELLLLPLAYHSLLLAALAAIGPEPFRLYALIGLLLVAAHVVQAMVLGKATAQDWKALLMVPAFVGWKLLNVLGILKAVRKTTAWQRTERRAN